MNEARHLVLNVPDVSCNHCKMAIEQAVAQVPGVESVDVEVDTKSVNVRIDSSGDLQAVRAAIEDEGYTVAGEHEFAV
ncbi:MAG TPA: cation transporter [Thermoleophilia bacterium]|nr:cation transporter [Thermoleophilia bacterium]